MGGESAQRGVAMTVSLRPITSANLAEITALQLAPGQERFVSTVADSMLEAIAEPAGRAIQWGLYSGDLAVGFVMISDEVDDIPGYIPHYLWKLLIDRRHQRQGYGSAALDLVADHFRRQPGVEVLSTSAGQGQGSPIPFYERYGFRRTGEIVFDDEVLLQLRLHPATG
jgi:ribosomal protein S18 acetylase RimI-like enzyme